ALVWPLALAYSCWLRYEFTLAPVNGLDLAFLALFAAGVQVGLGRWQGLYTGRWRFGSFEEVANLFGTVGITTVVVFVVNLIPDPRLVPSGAALVSGLVALVMMGGVRYGWRLYLEHLRRPDQERANRTIVYGAGDAGHQLVRAMTSDPRSPLLPVAVIDDDPRMQQHRLARHVAVVGTGEDLAAVAARYNAEIVVLAIPGATSELVRSVVAEGEQAGLDVRVLPPLWELAENKVRVSDVRAVTITDLLGRHELDLDSAAIAGYLADRRVLVTGAGGSIGSELCRQIAGYDPAELVMLDRDESSLHALQRGLDGEGRVDDERLVVADIRDADRMFEVFRRFRPEVVFHAAALKHVPLLELNAEEGVKTNVWGTRNVLEAARTTGVERLINVSTDKAADPVNVLGRTKLLAERLTAGVAQDADGTYLSVRFGNVLGSRGSMLTTFQHQLDAGGPITVTDEDVTRFFMTVEEAVELVIQAGAIGRDGEVLVLDMGEPVHIVEVARRVADSVDPPVEVRFTGLRVGEKLNEVLFSEDEQPQPTVHHLVHRVAGHPLGPDRLLAAWPPDLAAREALQAVLAITITPVAPQADRTN
ncbi:MAG: nucleoside-diphosphate sugar epimerase/dehydratase, partial [Acidimicrobiales bacterium]